VAGRKACWASARLPGPAEKWPAERHETLPPGALATQSPRAARVLDVAVVCSPVAGWWLGAADELVGATGRAPGKAVGGGAHPSAGAAWRRWRMLWAVAFNGDEATPMMDDVDGVALQCWGRRENVRGESIWMEREHAVVLTDNGGRRRCSGGN
jgi:hypothetical protein